MYKIKNSPEITILHIKNFQTNLTKSTKISAIEIRLLLYFVLQLLCLGGFLATASRGT